MASFSSTSFDTNAFSSVSFFFDAITQSLGGGKPKRKRKKPLLQLPDGTFVEVENKEEAEALLALFYTADPITKPRQKTRKKLQLKKSETTRKIDGERFKQVIFRPIHVKPISPSNIQASIDAEIKFKRIKRKRQEEEILSLITGNLRVMKKKPLTEEEFLLLL